MVDIEQVLTEFRPVLGRTAAMYAPPGSDRDALVQEVYLALLSALPSTGARAAAGNAAGLGVDPGGPIAARDRAGAS
jgi:hypothetical protein